MARYSNSGLEIKEEEVEEEEEEEEEEETMIGCDCCDCGVENAEEVEGRKLGAGCVRLRYVNISSCSDKFELDGPTS